MGSRPTQHCPVARALTAVGEKWSLLIVRDLLLDGPLRFQDLAESVDGIAPSTLSARLKSLEEHGVVTRRAYSDHPPRLEYLLTARGRRLGPVVAALRRWGVEQT